MTSSSPQSLLQTRTKETIIQQIRDNKAKHRSNSGCNQAVEVKEPPKEDFAYLPPPPANRSGIKISVTVTDPAHDPISPVGLYSQYNQASESRQVNRAGPWQPPASQFDPHQVHLQQYMARQSGFSFGQASRRGTLGQGEPETALQFGPQESPEVSSFSQFIQQARDDKRITGTLTEDKMAQAFSIATPRSQRQTQMLTEDGPAQPLKAPTSSFSKGYSITRKLSSQEGKRQPQKKKSLLSKIMSSFKRDLSRTSSFSSSFSEEESVKTPAQPVSPLRKMQSIVSKKNEEGRKRKKISATSHFYQIDIMDQNSKMEICKLPSETHIVKPKRELTIPMDHPAKLAWNFFIFAVTLANGIWLPVQLSFFDEPGSLIINITLSALYLIDILLSVRTTIFHRETGETVKNPKTIARHYLFSWGFIIDMLAALPFWVFGSSNGLNLRILTLLKFLRTRPTWTIGVYSENAKLSLKILSLFGYLILYIHFTACYLHHVVCQDRQWLPWQDRFESQEEDFYSADNITQYLTGIYTAILILLGNDTRPQTNWHIAVVSFFSVTGALVIANIFGTITLVVSALNRKTQKFQEKLDMANTSMGNMNLPGSIQRDIREFMMSTQCNLDTQKELDTFMQMVSPSLRNQVTKHIFLNAIARNPILQGSQEAIDFLINDVQVLLFMPEDHVVSQGEHGDSLYMIAKGDCTVWVVDHMRQQRFVRHLDQGEYFGEVSILYDTPRTATVKSSNYCTLAALSKKTFFGLCNSFPQIIVRMREKTLDYRDPWKQFRRKVLNEVEYFRGTASEHPFFLDEVQYNLQEEYFEPNSEIVGPDCPLKQITFVVQGKVDILVFDQDGNEMVLDSIGQGGSIGQYSVLFDEAPIFSAVARTRVRTLTLDQDFFVQNKEAIVGLDEAIVKCEDIVEANGIPLCDFQKFNLTRNVRMRLLQAKRKAQILENCLLLTKSPEKKDTSVVGQLSPLKFLDVAIWNKHKPRRSILSHHKLKPRKLLSSNKVKKLVKTISKNYESEQNNTSYSSSRQFTGRHGTPQKKDQTGSSPDASEESICSSSSDNNSSRQPSSQERKQKKDGDNAKRRKNRGKEFKLKVNKLESTQRPIPTQSRKTGLAISDMYVLSEQSYEDSNGSKASKTSKTSQEQSNIQSKSSKHKSAWPKHLSPNFFVLKRASGLSSQSISVQGDEPAVDKAPSGNYLALNRGCWLQKQRGSFRAKGISEGKMMKQRILLKGSHRKIT